MKPIFVWETEVLSDSFTRAQRRGPMTVAGTLVNVRRCEQPRHSGEQGAG